VRFLLIDRILELESGKRATGIKNVTMSEDYLTHHFPDRPILPGTLIIESLVQLADWIIREHGDFSQIGLATGFNRLKFRRVIRPGDQLRLEAEIVSMSEDEAQVKGKAFRGDALAASGSFTLALHSLNDYLSEKEARRLFGMLYVNEEEG